MVWSRLRAQHSLVHSDALDAELPLHQQSSSPTYIRRVLAHSDPEEGVRTVWYGSDANLGSGSICIHISFGMIRGSGPCPDPESFAFCISMSFFMDPDPGSRLTQQLQKKFQYDIFKRNQDPSLPLVDPFMFFLQFSFGKLRYAV